MTISQNHRADTVKCIDPTAKEETETIPSKDSLQRTMIDPIESLRFIQIDQCPTDARFFIDPLYDVAHHRRSASLLMSGTAQVCAISTSFLLTRANLSANTLAKIFKNALNRAMSPKLSMMSFFLSLFVASLLHGSEDWGYFRVATSYSWLLPRRNRATVMYKTRRADKSRLATCLKRSLHSYSICQRSFTVPCLSCHESWQAMKLCTKVYFAFWLTTFSVRLSKALLKGLTLPFELE